MIGKTNALEKGEKPEQTKTVEFESIESGMVIEPDEGYALKQVTVLTDAELIPENIKKDVRIFNVTGTYEGNSDRPVLPLPSEIKDEEDVIYALYDATGLICPIGVNIGCPGVCNIEISKYKNNQLISTSIEKIGTIGASTKTYTKYWQYDYNDDDYENYNYIMLTFKGSITSFSNKYTKYNGVEVDQRSFLREISGKCESCQLSVARTHFMDKFNFKGLRSLTSNENSIRDMTEIFLNSNFSSSLSFSQSPFVKVPFFDTSMVTNINYLFSSCANLTEVPAYDFSNVTQIYDAFNYCECLIKMSAYGMKVSFKLNYSKLMPRESLVEVLNNLATVDTTQTLTLGSTNLAKLTDEDKAIATNKGWTLA